MSGIRIKLRAAGLVLVFAGLAGVLQGCRSERDDRVYKEAAALISDFGDGTYVVPAPIASPLVPFNDVKVFTPMNEKGAVTVYGGYAKYLSGLKFSDPDLNVVRAAIGRDAADESRIVAAIFRKHDSAEIEVPASAGNPILCLFDDSQCAEGGRKFARATLDKISEEDLRARYATKQAEMRVAMNGVETVLNSMHSNLPEAKLKLAFADCCLRGFWPEVPQSYLSIENTSGINLTDVVIRVRSFGTGGTAVDTWHAVAIFPAGTKLAGYYPRPMGVAPLRIAPNVERLEIKIWSPQVRATTLTYNYAGAKKLSDIQAFAKDLKITAATWIENDGQRGVRLTTSKKILSPSQACVIFSANGQEQTACWPVEAWDGQPKDLVSDKLEIRPSRIDIYFKFDGSSEQYPAGTYTFNW